LTRYLIYSSASKNDSQLDADTQAVIVGLKKDVKLYTEKCAAMKEELYWFQKVAGFDFIPQKTKVSAIYLVLWFCECSYHLYLWKLGSSFKKQSIPAAVSDES
jgi:hypothetical protein